MTWSRSTGDGGGGGGGGGTPPPVTTTVPYINYLAQTADWVSDPNSTYVGGITTSNWASGQMAAGAAQLFDEGWQAGFELTADTLGQTLDRADKLIQFLRARIAHGNVAGTAFWIMFADSSGAAVQYTDLLSTFGCGHGDNTSTIVSFILRNGLFTTQTSNPNTVETLLSGAPGFHASGVGVRLGGLLNSGGRTNWSNAGEVATGGGGAMLFNDTFYLVIGGYRLTALGANTSYALTKAQICWSQEDEDA